MIVGGKAGGRDFSSGRHLLQRVPVSVAEQAIHRPELVILVIAHAVSTLVSDSKRDAGYFQNKAGGNDPQTGFAPPFRRLFALEPAEIVCGCSVTLPTG